MQRVSNGGSRPSDRGGGGGGDHPDPEMGGRSPKNFFGGAFGPQFGLKTRPPSPLDPPLVSDRLQEVAA